MRWRLILIGLYVLLPLAGLALSRSRFGWGMALVAIGLAGISLEMLWQKLEDKREGLSRLEWVVEVRRVADDLSLADYGIASLEELARYHDAAGRREVLSALLRQPEGQRSLLAAAREVDIEAQWD